MQAVPRDNYIFKQLLITCYNLQIMLLDIPCGVHYRFTNVCAPGQLQTMTCFAIFIVLKRTRFGHYATKVVWGQYNNMCIVHMAIYVLRLECTRRTRCTCVAGLILMEEELYQARSEITILLYFSYPLKIGCCSVQWRSCADRIRNPNHSPTPWPR